MVLRAPTKYHWHHCVLNLKQTLLVYTTAIYTSYTSKTETVVGRMTYRNDSDWYCIVLALDMNTSIPLSTVSPGLQVPP